MAGCKLNYKRRLKASSILEVIISMVIILLIFGIAMMISANVLNRSVSTKKIRAQALLTEILGKAEQNKDNQSQTLTLSDFTIEQEIKVYDNKPGLIQIHLIAYDANREQVAELQKVIVKENE